MWLAASLIVAFCLPLLAPHLAQASEPVAVGYRDFSFGSSGTSAPTGEKPESKLWWNDGFWWGSLYNNQAQAYHIYRFDVAAQDWIDTGTVLDDRAATNTDALWDNSSQKLYVVSHIFSQNAGQPANPGERGQLYRYSYSPITKTYTLDVPFPVEVTQGKGETLVLAKGSGGQLWVTYAEDQQVMVNHSLLGTNGTYDDTSWGVPYVLPVSDSTGLTTDDISSVIAFDGHIGVLWSNQNTSQMYFASHVDGEADMIWQGTVIYTVSADDHINLKSIQADSAGRVFGVIKTSRSSALIVVLACTSASGGCSSLSDWQNHTVYDSGTFSPTRGILLVDTTNRELYVFTRNKESNGDSGIYLKKTPMDNIQFSAGTIGTPFIKSSTDIDVNDPTSTKQNVNGITGLLVLGSDSQSNYYLHNYISLAGGNGPTITSFTPNSGPVGTLVTIAGNKFTGATGVAFNGVSAAFTVNSNTQITSTVPSGATTGKISVTTPSGTATSSQDFTVIVPPVINSFSPASGPVGTSVTINGSGFAGTTAVRFNGTTTAFSIVSSVQITATVPNGATTGPISVTNPAGTATSANFTVTGSTGGTAPTITSFAPTSGTAGTSVTISGLTFTGATQVKFNGTPASFSVNSDTQITATVPSAATTGPIGVTNSVGTGTSSTNFTVISSRIKDITFEGGSLLDATSGVDKVSGTVALETTQPLKGTYSARIPNVGSSYMDEDFNLTNDLYVSFYLRVNSLPASSTRIALISNSGTTIGNLYLNSDGSVRLRNGSTTIATTTFSLIVGQLYRIGIHQRKGSGSDALLEAFVAQADEAFGLPFARLSNGTWTTAADRWRIGATVSTAVDIVVDDMKLDSSAMPLP